MSMPLILHCLIWNHFSFMVRFHQPHWTLDLAHLSLIQSTKCAEMSWKSGRAESIKYKFSVMNEWQLKGMGEDASVFFLCHLDSCTNTCSLRVRDCLGLGQIWEEISKGVTVPECGWCYEGDELCSPSGTPSIPPLATRAMRTGGL